MNKTKYLLLSAILGVYAMLYIATKPDVPVPCEADCQKITELNNALYPNRGDYFRGAQRAYGTNRPSSDSINVYVKDTIITNWQLFADTVCTTASQVGLPHQHLFVIKVGVFPIDTLVRRTCP